MKTVTKNDFREVKAMLKAGWTDQVIMRRSEWSGKTISRIRNSKTFQEFRRKVYNETLSIRQRRETRDVGGGLLDSPVETPKFQDTRNKVKGLRRFLPW